MSVAVWNYPVPVEDSFSLLMPLGARPLTVQLQRGRPCLWALVNPDEPKVAHHFVLCGTGRERDIPAGSMRHVGTFQLSEGDLVFHLFSVPR